LTDVVTGVFRAVEKCLMPACLEEECRLTLNWRLGRSDHCWFVRCELLTPGNSRGRPKRERSVSVVKLGTLRYTAKLTGSQQRDVVTYKPGQIVEFHTMARGVVRSGIQEKRFSKASNSGKPFAGRGELSSSERMAPRGRLPLDEARKFSVFERQEITLSIGARIRLWAQVPQ
jgi:hypothetical protein